MNDFFYESIVADMFGIHPEDLSKKTRIGEIVLGRMFCMAYRNVHLRMTLSSSGIRYNKDHATVLYAVNKIETYKETKDIRYLQWEEFLEKCKSKLTSFKDMEIGVENISETINTHIEKSGFKGYITDIAYDFNRLINLIINEREEDDVKLQIDTCHKRIHELKYLYE
jgi:hypothetical protein